MNKVQLEKGDVFYFSDSHFAEVSKYAQEKYGLKVDEVKRNLLYARIARRMRYLNINCFEGYFSLIKESVSGVESEKFLSLLTTNFTSFFREQHHFEFLRQLTERRFSQNKDCMKMSIWSAGCSSGQEPYSIAAVLNETLSKNVDVNVEVLATDVDEIVLKKAHDGIYKNYEFRDLEAKSLEQLFSNISADSHDARIREDVRKIVSFRKLNLVDRWVNLEKFDVIFCRNVVIYFDRVTQAKLWQRLFDQMNEGGILIIGQSERLPRDFDSKFKSIGVTTYQKII